MSNRLTWKMIDIFITAIVIIVVAYFGNGWLAIVTWFYGVWNFIDGFIRSDWNKPEIDNGKISSYFSR